MRARPKPAAKLFAPEILWGAAVVVLLVTVALALSAGGKGPLAGLEGRGAALLPAMFGFGSLVSGVAAFRQFVAGAEGPRTATRLLLGLCLGLVGAAAWALVAFSLIFRLAAPEGAP